METNKDTTKHPVAEKVGTTTILGPKIAALLFAAVTGNVVGVATSGVDIVSELVRKQRDAIIHNLSLEENRRKILHQVKEQAKAEGCSLKIDDIDKEAQVTMEAGFDFNSLLDNLENLENLPALWKARRATPLGHDSAEYTKYHDLLLEKNVRAFVPLLTKMPEFQGLLLAYVSRKGKTLQDLSAAQQALIDEKTRYDIEFEKHYREGIIAHCNKVELFIRHDSLHDAERVQELEVAYVTLTLAKGDEFRQEVGGIAANMALDSLNTGARRLLILGKAGCGKTTLLRWIAIQAAKRTQPEEKANGRGEGDQERLHNQGAGLDWRDKIPFLLRMREYQKLRFPDPKEFHRCKEVFMEPADDWAEKVLKAGRAALLLDGLDELSTERRGEALVWIGRLAGTYSSDNLIVVSSRPAAVEVGVLDKAKFVAYEVCDLSPNGKREFVDNWHKAVACKLSPATDVQEQHEKDRLRMREQLESSFQLKQLASNPLLCALLCALNRVNRGKLPENLQDLCSSACQMLLKDRDDEKGLEQQSALPLYHALSDTKRRDSAQQIAYEMVKRPGALLSRNSVLTAIRHALCRGPQEANEEVEQVYKGLLERSGLLRKSGDNDVEFVHNTLRDYLAGLTFAETGEVKDLLSRLDEAEGGQRWEPILLFAVATEFHKKFVIALMEALLDFRNVPPERKLYRELLLLKANGRKEYPVPTALQERVDAVAQSLLPLDTMEKAEAIAEVGDGALEFLTWRVSMPEREAAACVHGLGLIDHEEARRRLTIVLKNDHRPAVLDELARCFKPEELDAIVNVLDIPAVQKQVQSYQGAEVAYRPFIRDLEPLRACTQLQALYLQGTKVSNLESLSACTELQVLNLQSTKVNNLEPLSACTQLKRLYLNNRLWIDVEPLAHLPNLSIYSFEQGD